jgi:hypothetical protein
MIGTLTNDMARLCGEIAALHESRGALRGQLAQGRTALKDAVSQLQGDLQNTRAEAASQTKAGLRDFVSKVNDSVASLRQEVGAFRRETLGDIAGARRAWCANILTRPRARTAPSEAPRSAAPKAKKKR